MKYTADTHSHAVYMKIILFLSKHNNKNSSSFQLYSYLQFKYRIFDFSIHLKGAFFFFCHFRQNKKERKQTKLEKQNTEGNLYSEEKKRLLSLFCIKGFRFRFLLLFFFAYNLDRFGTPHRISISIFFFRQLSLLFLSPHRTRVSRIDTFYLENVNMS